VRKKEKGTISQREKGITQQFPFFTRFNSLDLVLLLKKKLMKAL
jgi:hypothetical protein